MEKPRVSVKKNKKTKTKTKKQKTGGQNIKGSLLIKESRTSQVNEFAAFLSIGRCKTLGLLKLFL